MSATYEQELYKKALQFATEKHRGQMRLDGQPYMIHPLAVANTFTDTKTKIVALLHDVLEDTDTAFYEIRDIFGSEVARTVSVLTHEPYQIYDEYINLIKESGNSLAINVKIADLKHNLSTIGNILDLNKRERLKRRYENALKLLQE